jgi:hypothetical protein
MVQLEEWWFPSTKKKDDLMGFQSKHGDPWSVHPLENPDLSNQYFML